MIDNLKKAAVSVSLAIILFISALDWDPSLTSHATPTSDQISVRITQLTGLQSQQIDQIYAVEQAPNLVLVHYDFPIPVEVEPLIGYLLVRVAATGEWIRVFIEKNEWRTDFVPYLDQVGVEVHRQPNGTVDATDPAVEAAQIAAISAASGATIANTVLYGSPSGPGGSPAPAPQPHFEPEPGAASANASDMIGTTSGRFRVSESGATTYSIPIAAPAGTAGVAPAVTLEYSSASGNGIAGFGWSVSGISTVSRCRSTLGQDAVARGISWTNSDQFCLDGQRLVRTSGTHGADGSTYRTELDNATLVTIVGSANGGPDYFKVQRQDGSTSYYGKFPDSTNTSAKLNNSSGQTMTWAIRHFADSLGNPIWFDYDTSGGGQRIALIKYAYGLDRTNPSASHGAQIEFSYEIRPDRISGFVSGHLFANDRRLINIKSINIAADATEQLVRQYNLAYGADQDVSSDDISRLVSVQECIDSTCLPKTTFDWRVPNNTGSYRVSSGFTMANNNHALRAQRPADIDGDGKVDLVWLESAGSIPRLNYAISNGTDFVQQPFAGSSSSFCTGSAKKEICYSSVSGSLSLKLETFDFNIDGRSDVAVFDHAAGMWRIYLATPQGDGSWRLSANAVPSPAADGNITDRKAHFLDLNSDGLVDVLSMSTYGGLKVRYMEIDPNQSVDSPRYYRFGTQQPFVHSAPFWNTNYGFWQIIYNKLEISSYNADFNGDGRVDFMLTGQVDSECTLEAREPGSYLNCAPPESVNVAVITTGPNSFAKYAAISSSVPGKRIQTVDINSDGLTDIVYATSGNNFYFRLNRGNGTFETPTALNEPTLGQNPQNGDPGPDDPQFVDWNLDGYRDLAWKVTENSTTNSQARIKIRYWNPDSGNYDPVSTWPLMPLARKSKNEMVVFADMHGDGAPDVTRINMDSHGQVSVTRQVVSFGSDVSANQSINLIETITDGLGARTHITYEPLSTTGNYQRLNVDTTAGTEEFCESEPGFTFCFPVPITVADPTSFYIALNGGWDLPDGTQTLGKYRPVMEVNGPMQLVTRVESDAPAAGSDPGNVSTAARNAVDYHYGEAKVQASGRGFLGFERLKTIDAQTGVSTTTTYRQDWPFIGYPRKTEVRSSAGNLLKQSTNDWTFIEYSASSASAAESGGTASLGPIHPVLASSVEFDYDLSNNGGMQGALLRETTTTNTYDFEGNPDVVTLTSKDSSGLVIKSVRTDNDYLDTVTLPLREARLSKTTVTTTRQGETNPLTRATSFNYFASGDKRGLLAEDVVEPGNPAYRLVTSYGYDEFGNRVRSSVTGGDETRCDVVTEKYDSRGRHIVETFDCLGRKVGEVASRNKFGAPTRTKSIIDASGAATAIDIYYGALGREYFRRLPNGAFRKTYLTNQTSNCPAHATHKMLISAGGGSRSEECFDKLGRTVRSLTRGFDGNWDAQDTEYDILGRIAFRSESYDLQDGPQHWTRFSYDLLGRVIAATLPDGSSAATAYAGLSTIVTNDLGQSTTEIRNVLGEITDVYDDLGGHTKYEFDHQGNLKRMVDNAGNATELTFDVLGRKTSSRDPDQGDWTYVHNEFDELISQTSANGHRSTMTYDGLGRIKTRVDTCSSTNSGNCDGNSVTEGYAVWEYDTAAYGLGKVASVNDTISGYMRAESYDGQGRPSESTINFDGGIYHEKTTYDEFGRQFQKFDGAGSGSFGDSGIQFTYNSYGYLENVADAVLIDNLPRTTYRTITSMNARGQVTGQILGNGVSTTSQYSAKTGRIGSITSTSQHGEVQNLSYGWDTVGNLKHRYEYSGSKSLEESFEYDDLNRLTRQSVAGQPSVVVEYDAQHIGNIVSKTGVGTYSYGAGDAGPHAVTTVGSDTYAYDANGNNISGDGRTIKYTTFDKPYEIRKAGHTTTFSYGPNRGRYKRVDTGADGTTTTRYVGSVEIINRPDGTRQKKRYVAGVAIETSIFNSAGNLIDQQSHYIHKDHLGSVDVITDSSGRIVQEQSFDAWGQRRNASNWQPYSPIQIAAFDRSVTARGFTGHEMVDEVGVVHMNGRIYDPKLGRFLQADPNVQDAFNGQNLNRYSYVLNNPLNATDPSGYFFKKLFKLIVAAVASYFTFGAAYAALYSSFATTVTTAAGVTVSSLTAGAAVGLGASAGAIAGFVAGAITTGSLKGAVLGAFSGAVFGAIGGYFNGTAAEGGLGHIASHATAGGIMAELQGGKFGHGFLSAGLTKAVRVDRISLKGAAGFVSKTMAAAVIGGTVSKMTGGKFGNGAWSGGFAQAFNAGLKQIANALKELSTKLSNVRRRAVAQAWRDEIKLVQETGKGSRAWTEPELELLRQGKKPPGYYGHHINSVKEFPEQASDPNNIQFFNYDDHFAQHNYNWRNPTSGPLVDRTFSWALLGTAILETLSRFDPTTWAEQAAIQQCNAGDVSACGTLRFFGHGAGGFPDEI